jgi:nitroimidazol reductase NimA-like FMN-containing flavoprotein (pyridoxamine 5'-phosphate oxidase superfamily)
LPPAPAGPPDAVSPHGAGGQSIRWYEVVGEVRGYVPGQAGGYRVPQDALTPAALDFLFVDPMPVVGVSEADGSAGASVSQPTTLSVLPAAALEDLFLRHHVGHLGCVVDGRPYVVPITYVYVDGCVYGHTTPGRKLAALQAEPHVCFEVAESGPGGSWRSVVAQGIFEEVRDAAERARILARLHEATPEVVPAAADSVVYRLRLTEKTGRLLRPARPE